MLVGRRHQLEMAMGILFPELTLNQLKDAELTHFTGEDIVANSIRQILVRMVNDELFCDILM